MSIKEKNFYKVIGKNICTERKIADIRQHELAKLTGVSRPSICNIENGRQNVTAYHLFQISEALEVTIDELILEY